MPAAAANSVLDCGFSIPVYSQIANELATPIFRTLRKEQVLQQSHTAKMAIDKNGGPNHLRAWREFRRMSREQLADAITPPTTGAVIWHLEEGERGLSAKWLRKLAPALGTTPGYLLDHDPNTVGPDILEMWGRADDVQRGQIAAMAETVFKFQHAPAPETPKATGPGVRIVKLRGR